MTAYLLAAQQGYVNVVSAILDQGPDINQKNSAGINALILAASYGRIPVERQLLERGIGLGAKINQVRSALFSAMDWQSLPETVDLLLEAGMNPNVPDLKGCTPLIWGSALETDAPSGFSALMAAGANGNAGVTRALMDAGANLDLADARGVTPRKLAQGRKVESLFEPVAPAGHS